MRLVTTWFGVFLLDGDEVVDTELFPRSAQEIASRLSAVGTGQVLEEERSLVRRHSGGPGARAVRVAEERLSELGEVSRAPLVSLAPGDFGFPPALLREATLLMGERGVAEPPAGDWHVVQAIETLDEMGRAMNAVAERLRNWYSPHWPELQRAADDAVYAWVVSEFGDRGALDDRADGESEAAPPGADPEGLSALAKGSSGSALDGRDLEAVKVLAGSYRDLERRKGTIEAYIGESMKELAPNLNALAGPLTGARLISQAGSLERLARLPSSTIQVLGAEKALFSHLREGTRPPKHGLLFQHPLVHSAAWWQRGRIARHFAGKISIAVRADFYGGGGDELGRALLDDVTRRAAEVKDAIPDPPKRKRPAGIGHGEGGRRPFRSGRAGGRGRGGGGMNRGRRAPPGRGGRGGKRGGGRGHGR